MYRLEKPLLVPKGSKLIVTAHFDNSSKNKANPDPSKVVRFGDPTYDEMMVAYFDYVPVVARRDIAKLDPKIYDLYVGEYSAGPGMGVKVSREGERLMFTALGQPPMEALPESETRFFFSSFDARVTFVKDGSGQFNELVVEVNGRRLRAVRSGKAVASPNSK
jgi:hypothetical protein